MRFPPEETRRIREAVFRRAGYRCECGCGQPVAHLDHFRGRRVQQSEANCWGLSVGCDFNKTNSKPSAAYWCEKFIAHATKHGFHAEAERVGARLLVLKAKGMA